MKKRLKRHSEMPTYFSFVYNSSYPMCCSVGNIVMLSAEGFLAIKMKGLSPHAEVMTDEASALAMLAFCETGKSVGWARNNCPLPA